MRPWGPLVWWTLASKRLQQPPNDTTISLEWLRGGSTTHQDGCNGHSKCGQWLLAWQPRWPSKRRLWWLLAWQPLILRQLWWLLRHFLRLQQLYNYTTIILVHPTTTKWHNETASIKRAATVFRNMRLTGWLLWSCSFGRQLQWP